MAKFPIFLSTFDTFYAKLFDGVRQDSGDPFLFTDKMVAHYRKHHIDPAAKSIVFSDGLDVDKAVAIHEYCGGNVRDAYGIGTSLTNDVGVTPLNIVIKLIRCRTSEDKPWRPTVKLSDDPGKHTGDPEELENCMNLFHLKLLIRPINDDTNCHPVGRNDFTSSDSLQTARSRATAASQLDASQLKQNRLVKYPGKDKGVKKQL